MSVENGMWQSVTMQFPRFFVFLVVVFFLATNPNSIVEGKIAKKASLENWHSRNNNNNNKHLAQGAAESAFQLEVLRVGFPIPAVIMSAPVCMCVCAFQTTPFPNKQWHRVPLVVSCFPSLEVAARFFPRSFVQLKFCDNGRQQQARPKKKYKKNI